MAVQCKKCWFLPSVPRRVVYVFPAKVTIELRDVVTVLVVDTVIDLHPVAETLRCQGLKTTEQSFHHITEGGRTLDRF